MNEAAVLSLFDGNLESFVPAASALNQETYCHHEAAFLPDHVSPETPIRIPHGLTRLRRTFSPTSTRVIPYDITRFASCTA